MKNLKQTNEIKFSSYGVWELLRKVYQDKEELLPKLGFKKYEEFLDWMKTGDQDTQDEFESIITKHETEKMTPMTENILKQTIKEEIKRILNENMFKNGDTVMYMGEKHTIISDDGAIIKLKSSKDDIVNLNYAQAKEKVRKQDDFKEGKTNYTPGGWTTDKDHPWKVLPPGEYEVTYKPMLPLDALRTYTLNFPQGKTFNSYDEASSFYYSNQPRYSGIQDRMKTLVKVTKK